MLQHITWDSKKSPYSDNIFDDFVFKITFLIEMFVTNKSFVFQTVIVEKLTDKNVTNTVCIKDFDKIHLFWGVNIRL